MTQLRMLGMIAVLTVLLGLSAVLTGRGGQTGHVTAAVGGGAELFCSFENVQVWDISPETGFSLSLSTEHVTEGEHSLRVEFPEGKWPSINTSKLRQPATAYQALTFDVFNPQDAEVAFAIRLDDKKSRRAMLDYPLQPGMNHVRIPRHTIDREIDAAKLSFVVLLLKSPAQRVTLFFDNMRLASTPPAGSGQTARVAPPPFPAPETSGELQVPVLRLHGADGTPALASNGIPFAPGQLASERDVAVLFGGEELPVSTTVLARWPKDRSIRSLLLQFRLPMALPQESVTIRWGHPRTTADTDAVPVTWEQPEAFVQLPARWLCDSQVVGEQVPLYDHEFSDYDRNVRKYYPGRRDDVRKGDIRKDDYYSTANTFYQLYARSGELDMFLAARREAIYYRDNELILEGADRGRHKKYKSTRYIYVQGLAADYLLTGDERSREVAKMMADHLTQRFPPRKAFYPKRSTRYWNEREVSFPLVGVLAYYEISGEPSYLKTADEIVAQLYKLQQQWPDRGGFIHNLYAHDPEEHARRNEYGGSPFMTGLLLEGLVKHHRLTGSETSARSILLACDWLMTEGLAPGEDTLRYLTADWYRNEEGPPDLNLLVVHALGYGYRLSGYTRTDYLRTAARLFRRGVDSAFLKERKHFNQNYRSSGHFLAYIVLPPGFEPGAAAEPSTLFASGFEYATDGWISPLPGTVVAQARDVAHQGSASLRIRSISSTSRLAAGRQFEDWSLEAFPILQFAYRIPSGVPVGLRAQTRYGDWIQLGGTAGQPADDKAPGPLLIDDDAWHEVTINIAERVHRVLPGMTAMTGFQFYSSQEAEPEQMLWVDEFEIRKDARAGGR